MKSRHAGKKTKKKNIKQPPKENVEKTGKLGPAEDESWDADYDETIESPSDNNYYRPAGDRSRNL